MSNNKRVLTNTIFLATRVIITILISLYTTRIIFNELGTQEYGLFSVIFSIVTFFTFLTGSVSESIQRFFSIAIGKKFEGTLKNTFKNSIVICSILAFFIVITLYSIREYVTLYVLNIPSSSLEQANKLFAIALFSVCISTIQAPFRALVLANEKMSFYAYLTVFESVAKLSLSLALMLISSEKLLVYSALLLLSNLITFIVYAVYCFKMFNKAITGGKLSWKIISELCTFSLWNTFGNFAHVCRSQGIIISINLFFAVTVNTAYALANIIAQAINSLAQSLTTAIKPQIVKAYAEKDTERYNAMIYFGSKYAFIFLFTLCSSVLFQTHDILSLWLTDVPPYTVWFVRLMIIVTLIESFSSSLIAGMQATGRIRVYQFVLGTLICVNLPVIYYLFKAGFSVYYLFFPLIFISLLNFFLRIYFLSKSSGFDASLYLKTVIAKCLLPLLISLVAGMLISNSLTGVNAVLVILYAAMHSLLTFLIFAILATTKKEKKWVLTHFFQRKNEYQCNS
ncbi:lipopolysaccharide biosynthesis protein [Enterobacter asburiae]